MLLASVTHLDSLEDNQQYRCRCDDRREHRYAAQLIGEHRHREGDS